jgi:cobalt-zinc-cadmium efflux system protein
MILVVGSVFIIIAAVQRLQVPQEPHGLGMMALAILGILVNGAAVLKLRNSSSINAKAIMLHLLEDVLGWVAVLIGSIGIWLFQWNFLDPLLSLGIAVYILFNVIKNLKQSLKIFLQAIPSGINIEKLTEKLKEQPLVENIHDVHIWTMDGEYNVLSIHVVIKNEKTTVEELRPLKKDLEAILLKFGIEHSTIAFETINDDCALTNC